MLIKSMSSKRYWILLLLIAAFSLWLRSGFPLTAMPVYKHDDQLFVRLGHYLAAGQWLGPYDNLTLAKGIFYPMFIAAAFWTSIPLKIVEHILYLFVCGLTAGVARRFVGNALSLVMFALLAFNPVLWNYGLARVLRQGIYLSVALLVVTLVVMIGFPPPASPHGWRRHVVLGGGLGLSGTAYWLTREEGAWLVPALAVILAVALLGIFRPSWSLAPENHYLPSRSAQLKAIGTPLAIALIVFTAADWTVAALNYRYYGIFETNEFRARNFLRAYGALSRIQPDHSRYLVPFPKDVRQRAYDVSPATHELAPSLEGSTRDMWLQITCSYSVFKPCDEVETGVAMWELRDAVANAGHYKSGADAMRFYGAMADQIDAACEAKKITCLPARASMQPPFRPEYLRLAWGPARAITRLVFKMVEGPVIPMPSVGSDDAIAIFADTIDDIYLPEKAPIVIRGWVAAAAGTPGLRVESRTAEPSDTTVTRTPAPDVERVYSALKSFRFELRTNCPIPNCDLVLDVPGTGLAKFPLNSLVRPGPIPPSGQTATLMGYVDTASGIDAFALRDRRRSLQVEIANRIAPIYAYLFPKMGGVAALGLLLAIFFRRRFPLAAPLLALGLASATSVATYIVLMAYVKATAGMNVSIVVYLSPASPFVITFTAIGLHAWIVSFKTCRDRMRLQRLASVRTLQHIVLP